jgi:hypothetical protein
MLLIQALMHYYYKCPHLDPLKKKALLMAYIGKKHLTLMELQLIRILLYHLIVNIYHH